MEKHAEKIYIRDIPTETRIELCMTLDISGRRHNWKHLAGVLGFSADDVNMFEIEWKRPGGSPTDKILTVWDHRNHTITELYYKLYKISHARGMLLLKDLVDPGLHGMIDEIRGQPLSPGADYTDRLYVNIPKHDSEQLRAGRPPLQSDFPTLPHSMQRGTDQYRQQQVFMNDSMMAPQYVVASHQRQYPSGGYHQQASMSRRYHPMDNLYPLESQVSMQYRRQPHLFFPDRGYHHNPEMLGYHSNDNNLLGYSEEKLIPSPKIQHGSSENDFINMVHKQYPFNSSPAPQNTDQSMNRSDKHRVQQLKRDIAMKATLHKPYQEIAAATDNFSERYKLGEGSFGKVYLAELNLTKYAVKILKPNDFIGFQNKQRSDQIKELTALTNYKHKNIVLLCFFSIDNESSPCLVYEYLENGSLEDNLQCKNGKKVLPWRQRIRIAEGAALGINHLHTANSGEPLIHGDIKSANIILDQNFEPKIADFGLARPGPGQGKSCTILKTQFAHGTLPYLPPEFKRNFKLSAKVDIYSFGVVMMEIFTGRRASDDRKEPQKLLTDDVEEIYTAKYPQEREEAAIQLRDKNCPDWSTEMACNFLDLAVLCVNDKYKERPEMALVVQQLRELQDPVKNSGNHAFDVMGERRVIQGLPDARFPMDPPRDVTQEREIKERNEEVPYLLNQQYYPQESPYPPNNPQNRPNPELPNHHSSSERFPSTYLARINEPKQSAKRPVSHYSSTSSDDSYGLQSSDVSSTSAPPGAANLNQMQFQHYQKSREEKIFNDGYLRGLERGRYDSRIPLGAPAEGPCVQMPTMDYSFQSNDIKFPPNFKAESQTLYKVPLPRQAALELDTKVLQMRESTRLRDEADARANDVQHISLEDWRTRREPEQVTEPLCSPEM